MATPFPVGVLDLGALTVHGTLALAGEVDTLGYHRFWITEHHDAGSPHANPVLLAALVASGTRRMRVGPCGVLLRYCTPLAVAHDATLLEALFPGRIDFGVATSRAPEPQATALAGGLPTDDAALAARLGELLAITRRETPLVPLPAPDVDEGDAPGGSPPPVWVSGNGIGIAGFAAASGAGLAASSFHTAAPLSPAVFARYRDTFCPRPEFPAPRTALAVSVLCAATDADARMYHEMYQRLFGYERTIVGTAAQCVDELLALQLETGADELVVAPRQPTTVEAFHALARLAEALELPLASGLVPARDGPPATGGPRPPLPG